MNSLNLFEFKETIKNYIREQKIPAELKRMCLSEILEEVRQDAQAEIIKQAEEREVKDNGV